MRMRLPITLMIIFIFFLVASPVAAVRVKDITTIVGVRQNQLIGYGLVVGLNGTGDKDKTEFTLQSLINMLERMGIKVNVNDVKVKNVAAAVVTATLPPFARIGSRIDILISSIGDAKSLQGGTLLFTPLKAADGNIYAVAQGPLSTGGFAMGGAAGGGIQVNHPTVGKIIGGALVEKEISSEFNKKKTLLLSINNPDFATMSRLVKVINANFQREIAGSLDSATLKINIPETYSGNVVDFVSRVEGLEVIPDTVAKVILDERTGTIVMGENVRILTVAISHGNLSVIIKERREISQALPFAPSPFSGGEGKIDRSDEPAIAPGGQTVVVTDSEVLIEEEGGKLMLLTSGVSINELVRALNAIGVSPRDLIAILQAIKAAGALQAELEII